MVKAGFEYQELVGLVAKALDPNAEIKTGQWIEGPDGNREVDVEVRGTINGDPHFIHIECKDWKKRVGIQEIDNLDSKRKDISADAAIIYSNSGFTKNALRKAERLGIDAVSALACGNKLVRPVIERKLIAKALSVDSFHVVVYPNEGSNRNFPNTWDVQTLYFNGAPVINWLSGMSKNLLEKHEGATKIIENIAFKSETVFTLDDIPVILRGIRVEMNCSRKWLSQIVREDVSLGMYNHITHRLTVPNQQSWKIGFIDLKGWKNIDIEDVPEQWTRPVEPGTFRFNLALFNPIPEIKDKKTPLIDELIGERKTDIE